MATNTDLIQSPNRGMTVRQDFAGSQIQSSAETSIAAVAARERAEVEAMYLMAERHPRNWDDVRVRLLSHCNRPGFAEIARYKKPAGKKQIDGQWKETFAEGLSSRFAEIARQEAGNLSMGTSITYEDELIRHVRIFVVDVERNNRDSREVAIAKVVEKRGEKDKRTQEVLPPKGRDIISQRVNSYGDPVYLVKATDDEIRAKQNSEISKTQRDESLRLIPKDIRDDCEAAILATLADPKRTDPTAARKKMMDAFAKIGRLPSDLEKYVGSPMDRLSPMQVDELRGLYAAINDGEITFEEALRKKWDADYSSSEREKVLYEKLVDAELKRSEKSTAPGETAAERDMRIERQIAEQGDKAKAKESTIQDLPEWPDDPQSAELGKEIRVAGVWYRRADVDADWRKVEAAAEEKSEPAAKRAAPIFGKRS